MQTYDCYGYESEQAQLTLDDIAILTPRMEALGFTRTFATPATSVFETAEHRVTFHHKSTRDLKFFLDKLMGKAATALGLKEEVK